MRIKTVRGDFHDYRACVEKPGWSWDGRRKLPVAPSGKCWDEAIEKTKRFSRCRTKPFPWYKLVAEICGEKVPVEENDMNWSTDDALEEEEEEDNLLQPETGTEQYAKANLENENEIDVSSSSGKRSEDDLEAGEEEGLQNNDAFGAKHRIRSANWTDQQTRMFLDLLLEKHESGTNEYTECFWKELCSVLNERTEPQRSPVELRWRLKTLKSDFGDYRYCAEMWGWYWDNDKGLPVAPNEACWDELIKINKKYQKCRTKPFWWYEQVSKLCNKYPEIEHQTLTRQKHQTQTVKEASNPPPPLPLNTPETYTEQSYNSADGTPLTGNKSTASMYKEATNSYKSVAKKLVKIRSQFKLSRSDFIDMSVVVRDELNRELFMEQEGKELMEWIKDSLEMYREQRNRSGNRPFFMPVYAYPPNGPHM